MSFLLIFNSGTRDEAKSHREVSMKMSAVARLFAAMAILSVLAMPAAAAKKTVLYNFKGGLDGAWPSYGLIAGPDGALYGVTSYGGGLDKGTVFKLSPPATTGGSWKETILHRFGKGSDGVSPQQLIMDANGNLFGTTKYGGGTCDCGIIYELSPPAPGTTAWTMRVLRRFAGGKTGANPSGPLVADKTGGAYYGVTTCGGTAGVGAIFRITPAPLGQVSQTKIIYNFLGGTDGEYPTAGVYRNAAGVLYGTTAFGGTDSKGTAFKLEPPTATVADTFGRMRIVEKPWIKTILHNFSGYAVGQDGATPAGELIRDASAQFYGVTTAGGATASESGVVYKVTEDAGGTETVLYRFKDDVTDGHNPANGLTAGPSQTLWGSAGSKIFKLTPPVAPATDWTESIAYTFAGGVDGTAPCGVLTRVGGAFYGVTCSGGTGSSGGAGTIFKFVP
jgi:uncharacterized repeat protein (TIGR03803 family)